MHKDSANTTLSIDEAVPFTGSTKVTMTASRSSGDHPQKGPTQPNMIFAAMVAGFTLGALTEIASLGIFLFIGCIPHMWAWTLIWSFGQSLLCMLVMEAILILAGQSSPSNNDDSMGLSPMEVTFFGAHVIATASVYTVFSWCLVGSDQLIVSVGLVIMYLLVGVCCTMRSWVTTTNKEEEGATDAAYFLSEEEYAREYEP